MQNHHGHGCSDAAIGTRADRLRAQAEQGLIERLRTFAGSLHGRDVVRDVLPAPADQPAVVAYHTGGLTSTDEGPTDAYDAWDLVFDTEALPVGWADRIGTSAGLWHPAGTGAATATATFHIWA